MDDGNSDAVGAQASATTDGLTIALVSSNRYSTQELIEKLGKNSGVEKVEPNCLVYPTAPEDYSLNDEYAGYLYHVNSPAAKNTGGDNVDDRGSDPQTAGRLFR